MIGYLSIIPMVMSILSKTDFFPYTMDVLLPKALCLIIMDLFSVSKSEVFVIGSSSVESETVTGVTQSKIGDVCDLYICLGVRKAFLYFDPRVFVLVRLSTPFQTSLNRILCLSMVASYVNSKFHFHSVM